MSKEKPIKYYLYALSNLIAAFGGGMILGKGIRAINTSIFQGGSILAFFVGTIFGLLFLQVIPKNISNSIARLFSFCGAISSLIRGVPSKFIYFIIIWTYFTLQCLFVKRDLMYCDPIQLFFSVYECSYL
jgi:hypothetical protein